jgi:ribosomal protein L29
MDFKKKTDQDLKKDLASNRADLRGFRFGLAGSKTKNVKKGKEIRRDIARILTELNVRK